MVVHDILKPVKPLYRLFILVFFRFHSLCRHGAQKLNLHYSWQKIAWGLLFCHFVLKVTVMCWRDSHLPQQKKEFMSVCAYAKLSYACFFSLYSITWHLNQGQLSKRHWWKYCEDFSPHAEVYNNWRKLSDGISVIRDSCSDGAQQCRRDPLQALIMGSLS